MLDFYEIFSKRNHDGIVSWITVGLSKLLQLTVRFSHSIKLFFSNVLRRRRQIMTSQTR